LKKRENANPSFRKTFVAIRSSMKNIDPIYENQLSKLWKTNDPTDGNPAIQSRKTNDPIQEKPNNPIHENPQLGETQR
jgi:hypothetical protein